MKYTRSVKRAALLGVIGLSAAGCVQMAAHMINWYLSDPRDHNRVLDVRVEISFPMNQRTVKAVRYAEVGYLSGDGQTSYWPKCDASKRHCWYITNHFFIGLPNGDIMDVFLDTTALPLNYWPDAPIRGEAHLTHILRDQPPSQHSDSHGTCRSLSVDTVQHDYGYPAKGAYQSDVPIEIMLTRASKRQAAIVDPESVAMATILDEVSCKRLHPRFTADVTITP